MKHLFKFVTSQQGHIFIFAVIAILCFTGAWTFYKAYQKGKVKKVVCEMLTDTNSLCQKIMPNNKEKINTWFVEFKQDIHCSEHQQQ